MNEVKISGLLDTNPCFDHESFGKKIYGFFLNVKRKSGTIDRIPVLAESELIQELSEDSSVNIIGSFRSRNLMQGEKRKLNLYVYANKISPRKSGDDEDENEIILCGFICKEPILRKTPLGRDISDLLIAVARPNIKKSDYIPCITWGREATKASKIQVGSKVALKGRLQSRKYDKRISKTVIEERTAYELSVSRLEEIHEKD